MASRGGIELKEEEEEVEGNVLFSLKPAVVGGGLVLLFRLLHFLPFLYIRDGKEKRNSTHTRI
jgi:hypothetical protein